MSEFIQALIGVVIIAINQLRLRCAFHIDWVINHTRNAYDNLEDILIKNFPRFSYGSKNKIRYFHHLLNILDDPEVKLIILRENGIEAVVGLILFKAIQILRPLSVLDQDDKKCKRIAKVVLKLIEEFEVNDEFFDDLKVKSDIASIIRMEYVNYSSTRLKYFVEFAPYVFETAVALKSQLQTKVMDRKYAEALDEFLTDFEVK